MTMLAPFDGSPLSAAALRRAAEFGDYLGEEVVALAVIPELTEDAYAKERGWTEGDDEFDPEAVAERLEAEAREIAPDVTFRIERPSDPADEPFSSTTMNVVRAIREVAAELDADIVFIGSENAGRVSTPVTSVGAPVTKDPRYDVHIVRHVDEP